MCPTRIRLVDNNVKICGKRKQNANGRGPGFFAQLVTEIGANTISFNADFKWHRRLVISNQSIDSG